MKDITTEEEKLRQLNRKLSKHISMVEAQLASKETVQERLTSTIAMITHDLKTPLTGMKLFADILLDQAGNGDTEMCAKYLAMISAEAERASRMIVNIVDMQDIYNSTAEWREVEADVVQLVAMCARPFKRWCAAKQIGFNYASDVEHLLMSLDAGRISRLVSGLLANAFRFTEAGSVKIELQSQGEKLRLLVSDTGPGISDERLKNLIQPHQERPGLGKDIGLAFATAVVGHYQGQIWAESAVGKGSVFYVELPFLVSSESINVAGDR